MDFEAFLTEAPAAIFLLEIVTNDCAALHYKFYAFHFGDIFQRISGDGNEICIATLLDEPDLFAEVIVNAHGGVARGHAQGLRGRQSPFYVDGELIGLNAVSLEVGAAAKSLHHSGCDQSFETQFRESEARRLAAADLHVRLVERSREIPNRLIHGTHRSV